MNASTRRRRATQSARSSAAGWFAVLLVIASIAGLTCVIGADRPDSAVGRKPSDDAHAPIAHAPARPRAPDANDPTSSAIPDAGGIASSVHVALGIPTDADPADDYLMDKGSYVLSYNAARRVANWVSWYLNRSLLGSAHRRDKFLADDSLPPGFVRVSAHDYARSGYDRGHLCPSADRSDSDADNATTFLMTNMQPQLHELNDGPWKDVEEHERVLARQGKDVFIIAGGVFGASPRTIGPSNVAVPDASYKIIVSLDAGQRAADVTTATAVLAVIMPNQPGVSKKPWQQYAVSVDDVERATGYDYLSRVATAVQQVIEARVTLGP